MSGIIEVENLFFGYTTKDTILKGLSFELLRGRFLAIAGPNGAGKTTLLNLLCGSVRSNAGSIRIDAEDVGSYSVKQLAKKVAVVRQEIVPVFEFSVAEVVSMARTPYLGTFGFESGPDKKIIAEAMSVTDTQRFASRPLAQLSGGERQRVFIARALAQDTPILLLDEPTSFLDMKHQVGIYDLLKKMQLDRGKTILAVTHNINLAMQYCDEILLLASDGGYSHGPVEEVLNTELIEKVFAVRTLTGKTDIGTFFLPRGKFTKNSRRTGPETVET